MKKTNKTKRNNKKTKKSTTSRNSNRSGRGDGSVRVGIHSNDLMPPSLTRYLKYIDGNLIRSNSGANYLVYALRINDVYDPDPLILSGNISGYKELMQFYYYARVQNFKLNMDISNNETFPVQYGVVFSSLSLPGTISNRDDALNALETSFTTGVRLLSGKGGIDREDISLSITPAKVVGTNAVYNTNIDYACQITSSPNIPLYCNIIICSPSGTNLINGVTTAVTCGYLTKFYSRTNLRA